MAAGYRWLVLAAALLATGATAPGAAAGGGEALAASGYWSGFTDFWVGAFQKQNGVVLFALGLGAVCIFILTRGKWKK